MRAGMLEPLPEWRKLIVTIGIAVFSGTLFSLAGMLFAKIFFGINAAGNPEILNEFENPNVIGALKMIQVLGAGFGMFLVPALVCSFLFHPHPKTYLSLNAVKPKLLLIAVFFISAVSVPVINMLVEWNSRMSLPEFLQPLEQWMKESEANAARLTEVFLHTETAAGFMINLFMIALLPALGEELMFRGVLQRIFTGLTKNVHLSILISAVLFSAIHLQFFGFLPRMLLGIYLGYLLHWSGSIWLPVAAHFINNAGAVIFAVLLQHGKINFNPDTLGTQAEDRSVLLLAVLLTAGLLYFIYSQRKQKTETNRFPS